MSVSLHHVSSIDSTLKMNAVLYRVADPLLAEYFSPDPLLPRTSFTVTTIDTSERNHDGLATVVRKDVGDANSGINTIVSVSSVYVDGKWYHLPPDKGKRDQLAEELLRHQHPFQLIAVEVTSSNPDDVECELQVMRALMKEIQSEISDKWPKSRAFFAQSLIEE